MSEPTLHSAEYFGEPRDFWWHDDFIALMAKRWRLGDAHRVLEIGSGVGHWSRTLEPHLPPDVDFIGLEREPKWVAEATRRAKEAGLGQRLRYLKGDARTLPFDDGRFDLVTCQTVLIHLPDVAAAVRELMRVLKPGGLLAVAEPNNLAGALVLGHTRFNDDVEKVLNVARLQLVCERGKAALGEGHNSVGELLPGLFHQAGLTGVEVYQSDRPAPLVPPYESAAQRANVAQMAQWVQRDFHFWGPTETRRYFLAGGGTEAEFERLWADARDAGLRVAEAVAAKTEHQAGGNLFYLVSGRKPAQ